MGTASEKKSLWKRWSGLPKWAKVLSVATALLVVSGVLFYTKWRHYEVVTDGQRNVLPQKSVRKVIWDTAEKIDALGRVHPVTYGAVKDPRVTDGEYIAWAESSGGTNADIIGMKKTKGEWSVALPLQKINSGFDDWGPVYSPDGRYLFFYSNRPGGQGGWDIWAAERNDDGTWNEPKDLPAPVNSPADERFPTMHPSGKLLIFSSDRNKENGDDLFQVSVDELISGKEGVAVAPLTAVNSPYHERRPAVSPYGESLYFDSDRPGGSGGFDIYRSRFFEGGWEAAENLGSRVNGEYNDTHAAPSGAGYLILFTSDRDAVRRGEEDLFQSSSREIYEVERSYGLEDLLAFLSRLPWQFFVLLASCIVSTIIMWLLMKWFSPRLDRSSILQKCFAASIIVHILVWILMMQWMVEQHMDAGRGSEAGLLFAAPSGPVSTGDAPPWEKTGIVALSEQRAEMQSMTQRTSEVLESKETSQALSTQAKQEEFFNRPPSPSTQSSQNKTSPSESSTQEVSLPSVVLRPVARGTSGGKGEPSEMTGAKEVGLEKRSGESANNATAEGMRGKGNPSLSEWATHVSKETGDQGGGGAPEQLAGRSGGTTGPVMGKEGAIGSAEVTPGMVGGLPNKLPASASSGELKPGVGTGQMALKKEGESKEGGQSRDLLAQAGKLSSIDQPGIAQARGLPGGTISGERTIPGKDAGIKLPARYALRGNPGKNLVEGLRREGLPEDVAKKRADEIDDIVEGALRWMALHQESDGRWSMSAFQDNCVGDKKCSDPAQSKEKAHMQDPAQTGLVLLCFFAKGYTHVDQHHYKENLKRAIDYLLKMNNNGDLRCGGSMYTQGIVTMALAEAYIMTADDRLRKPLEDSVRFIINAQNPKTGGWRYGPGDPTSDTSVFGWQIQALKAADAAGIKFPRKVLDDAKRWLDAAKSGKDGGLYGYTGPAAHPAMTAEGLLAKLLIDGNTEGKDVEEGAGFLSQNLPKWEEPPPPTGRSTQRGARPVDLHTSTFNIYYWYYATQSLFNIGGDPSAKWNAAMYDILKAQQCKDGCSSGSWDPDDIWGTQYKLGRMYMTAMSTLCLEVYYRYLPVYLQNKGK